MLASGIVVFREVLEAALVIGIVMAATKGVARRGLWVLLGIALGLTGAGITALFADQLSDAMEGMGQEVFNASVLFAAVLMLGWHNIWMASHGRHLASDMRTTGGEVVSGTRSLWSLAIVISLVVLREGAEVVLFTYGLLASGMSALEFTAGAVGGLAVGFVVGFALYFGLLRIPLKHLFTVTSWMILLLAAGLASQAAGFLEQAGLLPAFGYQIWDTSNILGEDGLLGMTLHTLIGYSARPAGIQVIFYVATLLVIGLLMLAIGRRDARRTGGGKFATAAAMVFAAVAALVLFAGRAEAVTAKVYSPIVHGREFELEMYGQLTHDDGERAEIKQIFEVAYAPVDFWKTGLFIEFEREDDGPLRDEAVAWENIFQLTEQGEYFIDIGLYFEYEWATHGGDPDEIEFKVLLEKETGRFVHTLNLIFERKVGSHADDETTEFGYAARTRYRYKPNLEFAIEAYGEFGPLKNFNPGRDQEHFIGPVILGQIPLSRKSKLKYELGYLFGLTEHSGNGLLRWLVEVEWPL